MTRTYITAAIMAAAVSLGSFPLAADDFDGSKPLLCASVDTVECDWTGECQQGTAESINAPLFFRIDFNEKMIRATRPDGTDLNTRIASVTADGGALILQGVERGRGWSMEITGETGRMTLSAAGDRVGFIVFGACTPAS